MDVRRVRRWEWLTGAAGALLFVSLFLPWYGLDNVFGGGALPFDPTATVSGWQAMSVSDIVLAVVALGAIALPLVALSQRSAAVPQALTACLMPFAIAAAVVAIVRLLSTPDVDTMLRVITSDGEGGFSGRIDVTRELGAWLGAIAALGIAVFDYLSMADTRMPKAMRSRLDVVTLPTPTPDGERRDIAT